MSRKLFDFMFGDNLSKEEVFKFLQYEKECILKSNNLLSLTDSFKFKFCNKAELNAINELFEVEMKYYHRPQEITVEEMINIFLKVIDSVGYISWPFINEYGRVVKGGSWLP